jgi:hypothetical protein
MQKAISKNAKSKKAKMQNAKTKPQKPNHKKIPLAL